MDIRTYMSRYQPDMYHRMMEKGTFDSYAANVEQDVHDYVGLAIERAMDTPDYLEAQRNGNVEKMRQIGETARMLATSEAERKYICIEDEDLKEKIGVFEMKIASYSLYGGGHYDNIYFDDEKQEYLRLDEDDLDENGNDESGTHYPSYSEIHTDMQQQWSELLDEMISIREPYDKRYEISRYLELIFDNFTADPCVEELRQLFIKDVADEGEDTPMKMIIGYYINDDFDGLNDYIHYREIN